MTRPHDWAARLIAVVNARRTTPFAWGRHDCALFACEAARAVSGIDFAAGLRGRYRSAIGAARVLHRAGGGGRGGAAARIARAHGCAEVPPACAQAGDIVLIDALDPGGRRGEALAVCLGARLAAAGPDGLAFPPAEAAKRAWRVP